MNGSIAALCTMAAVAALAVAGCVKQQTNLPEPSEVAHAETVTDWPAR